MSVGPAPFYMLYEQEQVYPEPVDNSENKDQNDVKKDLLTPVHT